jgi:hypothetical protein
VGEMIFLFLGLPLFFSLIGDDDESLMSLVLLFILGIVEFFFFEDSGTGEVYEGDK